MFDLLLILCGTGSALVGGVLFAFSICVMGALATLPPAYGIRGMQAVNVLILNAWFLTAFVGTAILCAVLIVWSLTGGPLIAAVMPVAGSLLYLVGVVGITRVFNIPRNDALASAAPDTAAAAAFWADYLASWTAWNHVRTAAAVAAALAFGLALASQARLV